MHDVKINPKIGKYTLRGFCRHMLRNIDFYESRAYSICEIWRLYINDSSKPLFMTNYPFNGGIVDFTKEFREKRLYKNPLRLAWLKENAK